MNLKKLIASDPEEVVSVACAMMIADGGRQRLGKYMDFTEQMVMEAAEWLETLGRAKKKSASGASPKSEASSTTESSPAKSPVGQATTRPLETTG